MAELTAQVRKALFSGKAALSVALGLVAVIWGAHAVSRSGLVWDGSEWGLAEAQALTAELVPGSRILLVGPSPLERLLEPFSRQGGRLSVTRIDPAALAATPQGMALGLTTGDVQVQVQDRWMVLHQPDLDMLMWALALLSSPGAPQPDHPAPSPEVALKADTPLAGLVGGTGGRSQAGLWALFGLFLPLIVGGGGLAWGWVRRGR